MIASFHLKCHDAYVADGAVFVGQEAERQAAIDPARYEPNPMRGIDEGELLLGDTRAALAPRCDPCSDRKGSNPLLSAPTGSVQRDR